MSKNSPSPPAAPDPAATSAAQTSSNQQTALYNFGLNNPNYNTPLGNISYSVDTSDPNSPKSTANVSLSPAEQTLFDQQNQQSIGLSDLANKYQSKVADSLNTATPTPADIQTLTKNAQDAYYKQQTAYLDPQFQVSDEQLQSQLANQGIMPGSDAYKTAMDQQNRNKIFAYQQAQDSAITNGTGNAQQLFALNTAEQEQPLNEFDALRSGSQVQMPSFQGTNASSAPPTNVAGNINSSYQDQLGQYNAAIGQNNSLTGGLFGLGGSLGAAALTRYSDRRLKTNIRQIGKTPAGIPVYEYFYIWGGKKEFGVMAQEVEKVIPTAVIMGAGGYRRVNYAGVR